jgi:dTDP-4-amino-4,6-dideoxygalactose transaminase
LPVLIHYEIQPLFLDIDDKHYQPPQEAYTDQILSSADAVLLVATYGKRPDPAIVSHLQEHRKIIIEDYATLSPLCNDPVYGAARIYSLPKTLPTPDGGLAILPQDTRTSKLRAHKLSLTFIKNLFKLLPGIASRIARVRDTVSYSSNSASWSGITEPSNITKVIFDEYCKKPTPEGVDERYSYCYPLRVRDPGQALQKLRQHGISAERIWHRPIISHPEAKKRFNLDLNKYPNTMKIASEVVCVPLFHIDDQQSYDHYVRTLQKILADLLCE